MARRMALALILALALGLGLAACGGDDAAAPEPAETTEPAPPETTEPAPETTEPAPETTEPAEETEPEPAAGFDLEAALGADLASCEAPSGDPLVIGYAADFSEVGGFADVPGSEAAAFMAELINCAGGVNGTPVEVIVKDIQGDPEVTQRAAQELLDAGAQVILGPPFADFGAPLLQVTAGTVPVLFVASTEPTLPDLESLSFIVAFDDTKQAQVAAEFAREQGYETAVTFTFPGPYFGYTTEVFADAFSGAGGSVLADYTYDLADTDFSTQVNELANLPETPDVLYTAMIMPGVATLIGQIEGAGIQVPEDMAVIGADAFDATRIIDDPVASDGVYYTTHGFPGEGSAMKAFLDRFEEANGRPLETVSFGALAGDAVILAADAYARAGSLDPLAIAEALKQAQSVPVITGSVTYAGTEGSPEKPVYVHQIVGGEIQLAATFD